MTNSAHTRKCCIELQNAVVAVLVQDASYSGQITDSKPLCLLLRVSTVILIPCFLYDLTSFLIRDEM